MSTQREAAAAQVADALLEGQRSDVNDLELCRELWNQDVTDRVVEPFVGSGTGYALVPFRQPTSGRSTRGVWCVYSGGAIALFRVTLRADTLGDAFEVILSGQRDDLAVYFAEGGVIGESETLCYLVWTLPRVSAIVEIQLPVSERCSATEADLFQAADLMIDALAVYAAIDA